MPLTMEQKKDKLLKEFILKYHIFSNETILKATNYRPLNFNDYCQSAMLTAPSYIALDELIEIVYYELLEKHKEYLAIVEQIKNTKPNEITSKE